MALPPLLEEQRGMEVVVPPPVSTTVAMSTAHAIITKMVRERPAARLKRAAGGRQAGTKHRGKLSEPNKILPSENRKDPTAPLPVVQENELRKGLLCCIERGLIPQTFDVTDALSGMTGHTPLSVGPVHLKPHEEQFSRRDVLTAEYGLSNVCNVKLDVKSIVKPPEPAPPPEPPMPDTSEVPEDHLGAKQRDETRTYAELLDLYSLHEFVIRKGRVLDNTPEFQSYQRSYKPCWGAITEIIRRLEALLTEFMVPLAYIDGKQVARLAQIDIGTPSQQQLLECIANRDEVVPLLEVPGRRFQRGEAGIHSAATKIQSVIRMWLQRLRYSDLKESNIAAIMIQRHWHIHQQHMRTRRMITKSLAGEETAWRRGMDQFIRNWGKIRTQPRLIIHLPSLSYTPQQCGSVPFYECFQNSQLMRLIDLADPNVEVVYISPFHVETEALQYYIRIMQMAGVQNIEARLQVLTPENQRRLPPSLSLTKTTLFSERHMKRLASLTKGKTAYIVPGAMGKEELTLAARLQLPMLGPDPAIARHFSTKSGSKRIFEMADVAIPVGAYDMFEEGELLVILSKFIAEYPEYTRWLIKIDNEFNGRGLAVLDVRRLKCIEESNGETDVATLRERVYLELRDFMAKRAKIVNSQLYSDWGAYIAAFNQHGGVVEAVPSDCVASPTANIFIHPDGTVQLLSVQEQVLSPQYCQLGASFPQTSVPHPAVRDAALSIGTVCYQKKIMGHASIDFVVFRRNSKLRMWAVDLDLHLTNNALAHRLFQFATGARTDPETGQCLVTRGDGEGEQQLTYVYSGLIYHPYIGALRHSVFFSHCRQKGLSFDTQDRVGTLFHLVDSILRGCIGVLCIGRTEEEPIRMLSEAMEFIQQQLSNSSADDAETNFHYAAAAARALFQRFIALRRAQGVAKKTRSRSIGGQS